MDVEFCFYISLHKVYTVGNTGQLFVLRVKGCRCNCVHWANVKPHPGPESTVWYGEGTVTAIPVLVKL